jgi:hypothetical protein
VRLPPRRRRPACPRGSEGRSAFRRVDHRVTIAELNASAQGLPGTWSAQDNRRKTKYACKIRMQNTHAARTQDNRRKTKYGHRSRNEHRSALVAAFSMVTAPRRAGVDNKLAALHCARMFLSCTPGCSQWGQDCVE